MAITSGVEIYDNSQNQPKDLKGILESNSNDVIDLDLNIDKKEMSFINTLAEQDYDTRVQQNEANIQTLYAGGLDPAEEQTLRTDFEDYLRNKGKLSQYLDGKEVDGVTFSLEATKQTEIKNTINATKFQIQVFRSEVETYFLKQQVQSGGGNGNPGGNTQDNPNNAPQNGGTANPQDKPRKEFDPNSNLEDAKRYAHDKRSNVGIGYTAEYFGNLADGDDDNIDDDEEKKAFKQIFKGKDVGLDIVDRDYKPSLEDKTQTRVLMRVLLRIGGAKVGSQDLNADNIATALSDTIKAYNDGVVFDMGKGWRKKMKESGYSKDQYKLGAIYQITRDNETGFPYLKRVMDLLVQELTRVETTDAEGNPEEKDFADIFHKHHDIPKNLDLVTKKGQAIRAIEQGSRECRQDIKRLLNLAKDVDLTSLFDATAKDGAGNSINFLDRMRSGSKENLDRTLTKKENEFVKLCNKHIGDKDKDDEHFNYVLDGLRAGMTIQELANAAKWDITKMSSEEMTQENMFVHKFADINFDGINNFGDKDMVKGLQFEDIYRNVVTQMRYTDKIEKTADGKEVPYTKPLINMLTFGKDLAYKTGNTAFGDKIAKMLATPTFDNINNEINKSENAPTLRFLQKSLMESPLPIANIIKYGPNAYQEFYNNSLTLPAKWIKSVEKKLEPFDKYLDPVTKEGAIQAVTSFISTQQSGLGLGTSVNIGQLANAGDPALDYALSGLNINLALGVANASDPSGVLGLSLSRDKSWKVSKDVTVGAGVSTGVALAAGFVPLVNLSAEVGGEFQVNRKALEKKLNESSDKRILVGVNATLINYTIPSRGFEVGYKSDKMDGINEQYENIKTDTTSLMYKCLEGLQTISKNNIIDKTAALKEIEKILLETYPKSTNDSLHKSSANIYRGIQAFNLNEADLGNKTKKIQVAEMLGDFYALAWKNAAVCNLEGRSFDNGRIGIQFFAGFFPVPTISLQWATYKNLHYEDTKESQQLADKAEVTGDGNEVMSKDISEREIGLLNDLIEIPFKKTKAALNEKDPHNANQAPDILFDEKTHTMKVPFDLREKNILNVNLDPVLKGHIAIENDPTNADKAKYLVIPSDIPVRIFTEHLGEKVIYVLNLGDNKSDGGKRTEVDGKPVYQDLLLRSGFAITKFTGEKPEDNWLGDPKIPAFEKTTKIADVNALLKTLNVADYKNFPLVSAEKDKKQTVFTLAPQTNGKPEYLVSSKNNKNELNLTNNKLTLTPETGELIVNYSKKYNNYEFSYKPEPKDSLRISYKIGNLTSAEADPNSWAAPEANNKIDFSTTKLFEFLPDTPLYNADKLIDTNIGKLKDAEKAHMKAFKDFMFNLWKTEDDQNINDTELNNAKNNLAIILGEKNELVTFIETNKSDYKTVAYVMDRMKQIFALEAGYEGSTISYLRSRRGDIYHTCNSPSEKVLPGSLLREQLLPAPGTDKFNANKANLYPNLIGYTAFYRDKQHPGYSMTGLGKTTIYDKYISAPLDGDKLNDAKTWFHGNLEKQTYEKELLLEAVKAKIPEAYRNQVKPEDLTRFLETGENIITIDSGAKKYKLTLNTTYHFYLLGECANESLGMKINSIQVQEFKPGAGGSYGDIPYGYENPNIGLQVNNPQTRNEADKVKKTAGINFSLGGAKPKEVETPIDRGSTGADPDIIDFGSTGTQ